MNDTLLALLEEVGIRTQEELAAVGSREAFVRIRALVPGASLNMLYSLEGAVLKQHWQSLPDAKMKELLLFWNRLMENNIEH